MSQFEFSALPDDAKKKESLPDQEEVKRLQQKLFKMTHRLALVESRLDDMRTHYQQAMLQLDDARETISMMKREYSDTPENELVRYRKKIEDEHFRLTDLLMNLNIVRLAVDNPAKGLQAYGSILACFLEKNIEPPADFSVDSVDRSNVDDRVFLDNIDNVARLTALFHRVLNVLQLDQYLSARERFRLISEILDE